MSTTGVNSSGDLLDLVHEEDLDHEILERVTVAFESNPSQSLILLETEHASGAIAIDVSGLTLAEVWKRSARSPSTWTGWRITRFSRWTGVRTREPHPPGVWALETSGQCETCGWDPLDEDDRNQLAFDGGREA